jgi:hypothetical protein
MHSKWGGSQYGPMRLRLTATHLTNKSWRRADGLQANAVGSLTQLKGTQRSLVCVRNVDVQDR